MLSIHPINSGLYNIPSVMQVDHLGNEPVLELHEALSGIAGSISLAAWIFLLVGALLSNGIRILTY